MKLIEYTSYLFFTLLRKELGHYYATLIIVFYLLRERRLTVALMAESIHYRGLQFNIFPLYSY